jgi:hypothetical protein
MEGAGAAFFFSFVFAVVVICVCFVFSACLVLFCLVLSCLVTTYVVVCRLFRPDWPCSASPCVSLSCACLFSCFRRVFVSLCLSPMFYVSTAFLGDDTPPPPGPFQLQIRWNEKLNIGRAASIMKKETGRSVLAVTMLRIVCCTRCCSCYILLLLPFHW